MISLRRWLGAVIGAVMLTAGVGLGALPAGAKTGCVPRPGSEACLSYLFADNGTHFSAVKWQADITKAEGTTPGLNAKFHRLITKAKTQAEKTKVVQWFLKAIHGGGTQPGGDVPSWTTANSVCRKLLTGQGYKYARSLCQQWYAGFEVATGWKMQESNGQTTITVFGYTPNSKLVNGEIAYLQFPKWVQMPDTAAWTAEDSPLPLISWFRVMRSQRFDPGMVHLKSDQGGTLGDNESISAAQFLGFWGYGYSPVFWSTEVRRLMTDAHFNPLMAGGPNVADPAKTWPVWTSRVLNSKVLRAAGWEYVAWPEVAIARDGLPGMYGTGG